MLTRRLPTMKRRVSILAPLVLSVGAMAACATKYTDLLGQPAPLDAAQRTIVITPETKYVNIEGGQIVRFNVGDQSFAWNFFVARTIHAFDLNEVAPPGMLNHRVRVYLTPDPRYIGDGGHRHR
ncbi:CzcE family metal-binding protein [Noviherbaspirillum massiliense]|uniref:CzcE family metal-binding protein n=1 Tax=Noviherbaspirillum massiliense TaxID=1465823 RepID=UPI001FE03219|nr:CzcE family metal-binding protein [Noviherbaspirillum massiliense]